MLGYYAEGSEGQYRFVVPFSAFRVSSQEDENGDFYARVMVRADSASTAGVRTTEVLT
jgi:hypothetical protein